MSNLVRFEIKKFCNRKKNLLSIIVFILLVIVFITLNLNLENKLKKSEKTSIDLEIESVESALSNVEVELIRLPDNENLEKIKINYKEQLNLLKNIKCSYESGNFNEYLQYKIQLDEKLLSDIESESVISPQNPEEIKQSIEINKLLLEKNIEPIYTSVSMEGFNFIKLLLNNPISIVIVILIIILSADVMSSEFDFNTYKLLFTQPISKMKILLSKVIAILIMVNSTLFGVITISFCVLGVVNGFGSINYPIQFYNNNIIEYISIGEFILFEIVLFIIVTVFISILSVTISSFSKSTSNSISTTIILVVSAYMISNKGFLSNLSHLNPFVYFDISNVLQGNLAISYGNVNINFKFGVLVLGLSTIIFLIANVFLFKKNNISK